MKSTIVKIGGTILEDAAQRAEFLDAFAALEGPKILVHGGGKSASEWMKATGIAPAFIDGRRVTTREAMDIAIPVYSGINKQLVAGLQQRGVDAIGLCGADGQCIPAVKRSPEPVDFGWVGDPVFETGLSPLISALLSAGQCPVFSPLSYDVDSGLLLNTNADTIALFWSKCLQELGSVSLIYAFEHAGVLETIADPGSVIPELDEQQANLLRQQGIIHSGMLPKLACGFEALRLGATDVHIARYDRLSSGTQLKRL